MKSALRLTLLSLLALAIGCASGANRAPRASLDALEDRTRLLLHVDGDKFNSFNVTPAHLKLYVVRGETPDGTSSLIVCSRQERITESRVARDTCRGGNQSVGVPWQDQIAATYEFLAARALRRQLAEGTVDLDRKLLILDVTQDLYEFDAVSELAL